MAKALPIDAIVDTVTSAISVTSAAGSGGQALPSMKTVAIELEVPTLQGQPIAYNVGGAGWQQLDPGQSRRFAIDLLATQVLVRRVVETTQAAALTLRADRPTGASAEAGVPVGPLVVSASAPSNSDGLPNGTVWIQTA